MITNYKEFKEFIANISGKPSLLLHVCCAPCSTHTIDVLSPYFNITLFFSNDNIYPKGEFDYRIDELAKYISDKKLDISIISDSYEYSRFLHAIEGLEDKKEGSIRCYNCYKLRLERTAKFAKDNNYDYFTTSLSISPYKVSKWINEIGYALENEYDIKYLFSDFKKEDGYKKSIDISKEYNLYRQEYCGCSFSKQEREERTK